MAVLGSGVVFMRIGLLTSNITTLRLGRAELIHAGRRPDGRMNTMKTVGTFRDVMWRRLKHLCPSIVVSPNIFQVSW